MELIIDYPMPLTFNEGLVVCVPTTVTLQVDPDETVGDTDYWISAIWIEGNAMTKGVIATGKPTDHRVPDSDPMSESIRTYAYRTHKAQLDGLWEKYLNDLPRKRSRGS
jgi:hypothetical protein